MSSPPDRPVPVRDRPIHHATPYRRYAVPPPARSSARPGRLTGHVLLTGATGFLGQAMLERLLVDHPDTRISVLIRRRGTAPAADRLAGLARKPVFGALRERVGYAGVQAALADRVSALEGDIGGALPALPADLTAVLHCASTVSFDPPADEAFRINVQGVHDLYSALPASDTPPHVVHVSTAYVSAVRKGVIPEQSLAHDVDWRCELDHALAAREEAERLSRSPGVLGSLLESARARDGKAGPRAVVDAVEQDRRDWVHDRLVAAGRVRGQALGWTDVYTFTKALGERVAEERARAAGFRLSVVRPTIVQAALELPYPGWFESFKMMDPIVLAYGRGDIPEFPVHPESVIDLVPVDLVTSAVLAVAAAPGEQHGEPEYFHIGTGARNPLTQRDLHLQVSQYFRDHPLPSGARGHVKVPTWQFTGAAKAERTLKAAEKALGLADRVLLRLPATERTRNWLDRTHKDTRVTESLRKLLDLYGGYGSVEALYGDHNVLALHRAQAKGSPDFDVARVDWPSYIREVYCPAVTAVARRTAGPRKRRASPGNLPEGQDIAAVFDLEGTVLGSNLVEVYLWTRLIDRPRSAWPGELASLATSVPGYLRAERRDRGEFIRAFMRRYEGCGEAELRAVVRHRIGDALLHRSYPEAIRRIRDHRAAGHRTVLLTGTADILTEPLGPLFDEIVASRLQAHEGVLTGFLEGPPIVGEARAAWTRRYAGVAGIDLGRSYAYGDSFSDTPLLALVGNPVAVNPDARLYRHAKRRSWRIDHWGAYTGGRLEAAAIALSARPGRGANS
ncbi:HAD-IB family hydrolase [Streptomyces sp. MZ04]|uniref:HAD-IB family hydrolase n=1 Tax=Streptomyces sp. MZ04 TaxID=2559236 RepID=UPI00107EBB80|nr:HAD-IB family hydrolase [Streptomyces sp. MZ04]TGB15125.1 HAD-IB family hydrolase [Streptomyces sp. MZ04]